MLSRLTSKLTGKQAGGGAWYESLADGAAVAVDLVDQTLKSSAVPGEGDDAEPVETHFWVYKFELKVDGAVRIDFQESAESAAAKHAQITAAGVEGVPPLPPPEGMPPSIYAGSEAEAAAGSAAATEQGTALAAFFTELFSAKAAQDSEVVQGLFGEQGESIKMEIDDSADNYLAAAKQMVGKLSQGANLQYLQIPPRFLAPESTLEKTKALVSHIETLLEAPTEPGPDASLERMLAVLRWTFSQIKEEPFGLKPYNPVLGEKYRGVVPAPPSVPDAGPTVLLAEMISHHPPISATHVENAAKQVTISGSMEAVPRFWGNSVEVEFLGLRVVTMGSETYTMNVPSLCFRGIMGMGKQFTEWCNEMVISCEQSGVTATVDLLKLGMFGMRGEPNAVQGSITRSSKALAVVKTDYLNPSFDTAIAVSAGTQLIVHNMDNAEWYKVETTGLAAGQEPKVGFVPASMVEVTQEGGVETLFEIKGRHDQLISLVPADGSGAERTLCDRAAMAPESELTLPAEGKKLPKESAAVWGKLTAALGAEDWKAAREAKTSVEQAERVARKEPGFSFEPALFTLKEDSADFVVVDGAVDACLADCGVAAA